MSLPKLKVLLQISSDPPCLKVHQKSLSLQYDEFLRPVPPYSADNDHPLLTPLLHGGPVCHVPPYNGPLTTQYSDIKRLMQYLITEVFRGSGLYR